MVKIIENEYVIKKNKSNQTAQDEKKISHMKEAKKHLTLKKKEFMQTLSQIGDRYDK